MAQVSVIIPTYNSSAYIKETVFSILSQTFQDFEIVVVDDGSTDNTLEIIKSFNDPRIYIYKNDINTGISYSHNRLLQLATSRYIAIHDHDDVSMPFRLERQLDILRSRPELIAVASYPRYIGSDGIEKKQNVLKKKLRRLIRIHNSYYPINEVFPTLLFKNFFCHPTLMLDKNKLTGMRYNQYLVCDDYDLIIRICEKQPIFIDEKPVLKYRVHNVNTSSLKYKDREKEVNEIQGRFLSKLGIEVTSSNLFIHNGFYNDVDNFNPSTEYLIRSIEWYILLMQKNKKAGFYDEKSLEDVIELNWFERCMASTTIGFEVFRLYIKNKFSKRRVWVRWIRAIFILLTIYFGNKKLD